MMFGLDVKALLSATQNIHKMAWEQVLLLAIYSRQQCFTQNGLEFENRIKLVHEAKNHQEVCESVLKSLAQGKGSNEIIGMLLSNNNSQSGMLLKSVEKRRIAFSSEDRSHPYSYYAMYSILSNPLTIFQSLLDFSRFSLPDYIANIWHNQHTNLLAILDKDNPLLDRSLSLDELTDILEKRKHNLNTKAFSMEVKGSLAKDIGKNLKATFDQFTWRNQTNFSPVSLFSEICNSTKGEVNFCLDFNAAKLRNMINLGQIDSLMDGIKGELITAYGKSPTTVLFGQQDNKNLSGAVDALSNWYKAVNTGIIKKIERVPRVIASILYFDLRYERGIGSEVFGLVNIQKLFINKLTTRDYENLVTGIIRHALFKTGRVNDLRGSPHHCYESVEHYFSKVPELDEQTLSTFSLMKVWADQEPGPMLERFKKLPLYLKNTPKYEEVSSKIHRQQRLSRDEASPYPINSLFPLPLWAKLNDEL